MAGLCIVTEIKKKLVKIGSFHKMAGILSGPRALFISLFITRFSSVTVNSPVDMFKRLVILIFGRDTWTGRLAGFAK